MKITAALLITFILCSFFSYGQEKKDILDFRIGVGISLLGSGDMVTINYENEVNYKLNTYFTGSISLNLGNSNRGVYERASFTQGNLNFYLSPFKNCNRFDFRLGAGVTYYYISDEYKESEHYLNGQLIDVDYHFDKRSSIGFNFLIENSYFISQRFLIGVKLYTQSYFNGDINSGVSLKFGMKI